MDFKKDNMKVYSETSHTFKIEIPAKIVTNMHIYTNIHINTRTYSKVEFKKLFSQAYSGFSHTSTIKIFAKVVNTFEYKLLSPEMSQKVLCEKFMKSIELNTCSVISYRKHYLLARRSK